MKIYVIGSMKFSEEMVDIREKLSKAGHQVVLSNFVEEFLGKTDLEKEEIKITQKNSQNAMLTDCQLIPNQDAVLMLNLDKNGIKNYVGGNALIELGYAHILGKKIFFYNPIPDITYYKSELEAMKPIIINGDLNLVR